MKKDKIIKFSNNLALLLIGILIYWVFIFISITIFDFKIFRENITEAFFLSITGIIALLSGSIIINIMFNLTKISESLGKDKEEKEDHPKINKKIIILIALSFLIIFGLLYLGDLSSTQKKHNQLVSSAEYLIEENQHILQDLVNYKFTKSYLDKTSRLLKLLSQVDENFPEVELIIRDQIELKEVFLKYDQYLYEEEIDKTDFIYPSSKEERLYFEKAFTGKDNSYLFSSHDGFYELYYPVTIDAKTIILYFTDQQRYGKYGS